MQQKINTLISIVKLATAILEDVKKDLARAVEANSIVVPEPNNKQIFMNKTCPEFVEWTTSGSLPLGVKIYRPNYRDSFLNAYPSCDSSFISPKRFAIWIKCYAEYAGLYHQSKKTNSSRFSILTIMK